MAHQLQSTPSSGLASMAASMVKSLLVEEVLDLRIADRFAVL